MKLSCVGCRWLSAAVVLSVLLLCGAGVVDAQEVAWPDLMKGGPKVGGGEHDAAVVVGIEDYLFVGKVPGAVDNALAWSRWLSQDRSVPLGRITVLTNADGTKERIEEAVERASKQVERGGQLWLVFIGHGAPSKDGRDGMLVGVDVQQNASSIYARSVSRQKVLESVKLARVPHAVLVLDTCFSGRGSTNEVLASGLQPLIPVKETRPLTEVTVLTAGRGDQFAGPLPGASRPAFSYLLLGALRGWGDRDGNGEVSAQEAVDYVTENLSFLLAGSRTQTPELWAADAKQPLVRGRKLEAGPDVFALSTALRRGTEATNHGSNGSGPVPSRGVEWGTGGGQTAIVEFDSTPQGAAVLVDGKLLCQATPCSKALPHGRHAVELAGDCFVPHTETLDLGSGGGRVRAVLEPRLAGIEVSAHDDKGNDLVADVLVDGVRVGKAPGRFEVGVCSKQVVVKKDGLGDFVATLALKPGAAQRLEATLKGAGGMVGMVEIPAGKFTRGSDDKDDQKPRGEVYVSGFWIDKTEVTVDAYAACVKAGKCAEPDTSSETCSNSNWTNRVSRGAHPINCVSWSQADTYCRFVGKRLPTEAEWEKAARGTDGRTYPWGEAVATCSHAVVGQGCGQNGTWPVGSKPDGASPYGALDMIGNVAEWVADWYDAKAYADASTRDPKGPDSGSGRATRGSGWTNSPRDRTLRAAYRFGLRPGLVYVDLGFRCARSMP